MKRSIIKVFLASPGDLVEERKTAKKIAEEENRNHAIPAGYQFELVGWEDTVAQHGRAQAVINRDLDQCDYFIGLIWKRWGSPPGPDGGPYSSGFEEEYERATDRFNKTGTPRISILFKSVDSSEISDAGPQLRRVLDFQRSFINEYKGVFHTFDDLSTFETQFRSILSHFLRKEIEENRNSESEEQSRTLESGREPEENTADTGNFLFDKEARAFLSDLISRISVENEYAFTAADAARFRLLGCSLRRSENDQEALGVHDANIIYKEFRGQNISSREIGSLIETGLEYFISQNAPLWAWLHHGGSAPVKLIALRTVVGPDEQIKSAFQILALLGDEFPALDEPLSRTNLVKWWLARNESSLVVSALNYLSRCGNQIDLESIDELLDSPDSTISKTAATSKICILMRASSELALEFIATREEMEVPDNCSDAIFTNPSSLKTNLLKKCLSNRSNIFKRRVAEELLNRGELLLGDGKALVQSEDAAIRLIGAKAIRMQNAAYSLSEARDDLIKPKKDFTSTSLVNYDFDGERSFDLYINTVYCSYQKDILEQMRASESIYSHAASFALYEKYFKSYREEITRCLEDGFSGFLDDKIRRSEPGLAPADNVKDYMKRNLVQEAVELVSKKGGAESISAIRHAVDRGDISYSSNIIYYFEKNGEWEDIPRIIKILGNFSLVGLDFFMIGRQDKLKLSSKAILNLGRDRIADLLSIPMPNDLWNYVIYFMKKSHFAGFDNDTISGWLRDENSSKRKYVAIKCVACLPKRRISSILDTYIADGEQYYYNVVFWLDLGISVDRAQSVRIAKAAIADA